MVATIPQQVAATASSTKNGDSQEEENPTTSSGTRPPLLPSGKDNNARNGVNNPRKPRGRPVSSRYMSPSPSSSSSSSSTTKTTISAKTPSQSQRFSSPLLSRSTNSPSAQTAFQSLAPKRSASVDRRRPMSATTPRPTTPVPNSKQTNASQELSTATKMLITSSRSLSVSFQGEAFSLPISKTKAKATPERRRATPVRDQPWPSRVRSGNPGSNPLARSLDCSIDSKLVGVGSGLVAKSLNQSLIEYESRSSLDLSSAKQNPDGHLLVNESSDVVTSDDADSVSSGSTNTSGVPDSGVLSKMKNGARGLVVSARFWQETNSRLRRLQDPGSPLSTSPGSRMSTNPSKYLQPKRFSGDGAVNMSPRTMSSPIRGATRPSSPSKVWNGPGMSPSRGIASPSRVRNVVGGALSGNSGNTPSILSFSVDIRRGKMGEDRIVDAHMLRLLYNRYLQWRFVNARADTTFRVQKLDAEKNLWNAWVRISELRHSVTLRRIKLLLLSQKLKLTSILKGQMSYLEEWTLLDKDHSSSLVGATEALKASTLRLPIVGKAIADIQKLKDAISSAVDVMQAMASSIYLLSSKVENMNSLMAELMNVTAKERIYLEHCKEFSSTLAVMQVKDCSLRTHIIQLNRVRTTQT